LKEHRIEELSAKLEKAGLPYAPIARPDQLLDDPHLKASGGLVPIQTEDGGVAQSVLLPMLMNGRRLGVQRPLPAVGEHNDEVLKAVSARTPGASPLSIPGSDRR
jgi:crotonobetainyl-CoA:carnitine CoA-transferase CaiB-like acyl-CoA transferase